MAILPLGASTSQKSEHRVSKRRLWPMLFSVVLLVGGIVFAPPFGYGSRTHDATEPPRIATADHQPQWFTSAGKVLPSHSGQHAQSTPPPDTNSSLVASPIPAPQPNPLVSLAHYLIRPAQTIIPVLPASDLKDNIPSVEAPIVACEPLTSSPNEISLAGAYVSDGQDGASLELEQPNAVYTYSVTPPEGCVVSWQPISATITWVQDGTAPVDEPLAMVLASSRDTDTHMYHGNTLQFQFAPGQVALPAFEQSFTFMVHYAGQVEAQQHTIRVKVAAEARSAPPVCTTDTEGDGCGQSSDQPPSDNTVEQPAEQPSTVVPSEPHTSPL